MADPGQAGPKSLLTLPIPPPQLHNGPPARSAFNAHYSNSAPHQQSNNNVRMNPQINDEANNAFQMTSNGPRPANGAPSSRAATPCPPQGSASEEAIPTTPNQPPPPYKSPYAQSAPFPPAAAQIKTPTPLYSQNNHQTDTQPRSATCTPAPATLNAPPRAGISNTFGYKAYSQEFRKTESNEQIKVRSERLSPVSHVREVLSIVSGTVFVPTELRRLAGVMAGNPMINSVKVIHHIADKYEDVCDQLDDRDATIRQLQASQDQLRASKAQMEAEHARKTQHAVEDAVRFAVRPHAKPTAQQEADLRDKDVKIKGLETFFKDQASRMGGIEAAWEHAQEAQLDLKKKHVLELAAAKDHSDKLEEELIGAKRRIGELTEELSAAKNRCKKLEYEPSAAQNQAQQHQRSLQNQSDSLSSLYGHNHGNAQDLVQSQILDQNQAFGQSEAFGTQGLDIDLDKLFAEHDILQEQQNRLNPVTNATIQTSPSVDEEEQNISRPNGNLTQHNQQNIDDLFDFLQAPNMPGFQQSALLQGSNIQQAGDFLDIDDPFGIVSQQGNLFQPETSPQAARRVQQSFDTQNIAMQEGHQVYQKIQNMQSQGQGQNQQSPITPGRQQRTSAQLQQSPERFQPMPGQMQQSPMGYQQMMGRNQQSPVRYQQLPVQGQVNVMTPSRQRRASSQQSTPRRQNTPSQNQTQRARSTPSRQQTPQSTRQRGRPAGLTQRASSAQQNVNLQAYQQAVQASQQRHQNRNTSSPQASSSPHPRPGSGQARPRRMTTQAQGPPPRKIAVEIPQMTAIPTTAPSRAVPQGYLNMPQHPGYGPTTIQGNGDGNGNRTQYSPLQPRKRAAPSQEEDEDEAVQHGEEFDELQFRGTDHGEAGKITLNTLRRNVRKKYDHGDGNVDGGGFKRSF